MGRAARIVLRAFEVDLIARERNRRRGSHVPPFVFGGMECRFFDSGLCDALNGRSFSTCGQRNGHIGIVFVEQSPFD
jgi:hypothetical protein